MHYKKGIALLTGVFFILNEFAMMAPLGLAAASATPAPVAVTHPAVQMEIPSEWGSIEESWSAAGAEPSKTIVYIQDAHDSLDAQESIAKIIGHLVEKKGVQTVFTEGYEGMMPNDEYFGFIKNPETKKRVTYFFMDQLRIGGAEYAHINRVKDFDLVGADSIALHRQNIKGYQDSAEQSQTIEQDLKAIETSIQNLADRYFPKELKQWVQWKKSFDENQIELLDYLRRLSALQGPTGSTDVLAQKTQSYPHIHKLLNSNAAMEPAALESLKQIHAQELFQEIKLFEKTLAESHLKNERDRQIFEYYRSLGYLKRLNRIQVTSEEYRVLKKSLNELKTQDIARFIVEQTNRTLVLAKTWEENIQYAMSFYEIAEAREAALEKTLLTYGAEVSRPNTQEKMPGVRPGIPAILVFGGFHKENIKAFLKKNGFSYVLVTPKITEISERHQTYYKQLMKQGFNSIEFPSLLATAARQPIFEELLAVNPSFRTRFDAMVRAAVRAAERVGPNETEQQAAGEMRLWMRDGEEKSRRKEAGGREKRADRLASPENGSLSTFGLPPLASGARSEVRADQGRVQITAATLSSTAKRQGLKGKTVVWKSQSTDVFGVIVAVTASALTIELENGTNKSVSAGGLNVILYFLASRDDIQQLEANRLAGAEQEVSTSLREQQWQESAERGPSERPNPKKYSKKVATAEKLAAVDMTPFQPGVSIVDKQLGRLKIESLEYDESLGVAALVTGMRGQTRFTIRNLKNKIALGQTALLYESPRQYTKAALKIIDARSHKYLSYDAVPLLFAFDSYVYRLRDLEGTSNYYQTVFSRHFPGESIGESIKKVWAYLGRSGVVDLSDRRESIKDSWIYTQLIELLLEVYKQTGEDFVLTGVLDHYGRLMDKKNKPADLKSQQKKNKSAFSRQFFYDETWEFNTSKILGQLSRRDDGIGSFKGFMSTKRRAKIDRWRPFVLLPNDVQKYMEMRLLKQGLRTIKDAQNVPVMSSQDYETVHRQFYGSLRPYFSKSSGSHDEFSKLILDLPHAIRQRFDFSSLAPVISLVQNSLETQKSDFLQPQQYTLVVPAPGLSFWGNQSIPLAAYVAGQLGLPVEVDGLRQTRPRKSQRSFSKLERRARNAAADLFEGNSGILKGQDVLIVDDNETSAFTARALLAEGYRKGAKSVRILSIGKTASRSTAVAANIGTAQPASDSDIKAIHGRIAGQIIEVALHELQKLSGQFVVALGQIDAPQHRKAAVELLTNTIALTNGLARFMETNGMDIPNESSVYQNMDAFLSLFFEQNQGKDMGGVFVKWMSAWFSLAAVLPEKSDHLYRALIGLTEKMPTVRGAFYIEVFKLLARFPQKEEDVWALVSHFMETRFEAMTSGKAQFVSDFLLLLPDLFSDMSEASRRQNLDRAKSMVKQLEASFSRRAALDASKQQLLQATLGKLDAAAQRSEVRTGSMDGERRTMPATDALAGRDDGRMTDDGRRTRDGATQQALVEEQMRLTYGLLRRMKDKMTVTVADQKDRTVVRFAEDQETVQFESETFSKLRHLMQGYAGDPSYGHGSEVKAALAELNDWQWQQNGPHYSADHSLGMKAPADYGLVLYQLKTPERLDNESALAAIINKLSGREIRQLVSELSTLVELTSEDLKELYSERLKGVKKITAELDALLASGGVVEPLENSSPSVSKSRSEVRSSKTVRQKDIRGDKLLRVIGDLLKEQAFPKFDGVSARRYANYLEILFDEAVVFRGDVTGPVGASLDSPISGILKGLISDRVKQLRSDPNYNEGDFIENDFRYNLTLTSRPLLEEEQSKLRTNDVLKNFYTLQITESKQTAALKRDRALQRLGLAMMHLIQTRDIEELANSRDESYRGFMADISRTEEGRQRIVRWRENAAHVRHGWLSELSNSVRQQILREPLVLKVLAITETEKRERAITNLNQAVIAAMGKDKDNVDKNRIRTTLRRLIQNEIGKRSEGDAPQRSEVRREKAEDRQAATFGLPPSADQSQPSASTVDAAKALPSLKQLLKEIGPTVVFVDAKAQFKDETQAEQVAKELARLADAGARIEPYDIDLGEPQSLFYQRLMSFSEGTPGSYAKKLERFRNRPGIHLVHYAAGQTTLKRTIEATQPWTRERVIYLVGKAGSAVYGLTQISRIEQVRERLLKTGEEIKGIAELEISIREEQFLVSDAKASWTQILLEAQSIVEFAKAA